MAVKSEKTLGTEKVNESFTILKEPLEIGWKEKSEFSSETKLLTAKNKTEAKVISNTTNKKSGKTWVSQRYENHLGCILR